jgi:ribosomal protein S18 acetylase RimI-like enzyme
LNVPIRPLTPADEPFLWEMLYQALFVPPGEEPFPRDILSQPEISRYARDWGQPHDLGFVATADDRAVGAAWLRLLIGENKGFAYVDDHTPELSIAVSPEYRGQGIGRQLLERLLDAARARGRYSAVCLSVDARNPAARLYRRLGFKVVKTSGRSLTMVKDLR